MGRIISGFCCNPMRCPKCYAIMVEHINGCYAENWGSCDCGYHYDDCDYFDPEEEFGDYYLNPDDRKSLPALPTVEEAHAEQDCFLHLNQPW